LATITTITKKYGVNGLYNYLKLKSGNTESLWLAGYKNPIRLRKVKADLLLFKQIFVTEEYKFNCPITPKYIIDAGANIGLSALFFSKSFPAAKIIAVEVEKGNFDLLVENTQGYPEIETINAGIWPTTAKLEVVDTGRGPTGFMVREATEEATNVFDAISINDIMNQYTLPHIDILKIDIEGAEKELLLQNSDWISRTKIIIIELHDNKKEGCSKAFFDTFSNYNFECHPFGQNFLLINKSFRE
jgi:FkbM family methyltransferase